MPSNLYVTASEAARAVGCKTDEATRLRLSDLNAANIAKFLQETHDEAASEVRTIGRAIEINENRNPAKVGNLTSRRDKYADMRNRAHFLLGLPEREIVAMLGSNPVNRTTIRALCEKGRK